MQLRSKIGQTVVIALIIGLLYLRTQDKRGSSASANRAGVLFFLAVNNVMSNCIGILSIFGLEKRVFAREQGAGYYSLASYFSSKIMVELPFQIIFPWLGG